MRNSGVVFVSCLVGLVVLGSASAVVAQTDQELKQAQANDPVVITGPLTKSVDPVQTERGPRQPGVNIIYDDGIVTALPAVSSFTYGNQFNSANGVPVTSFSVTRMSFYMFDVGGTAAFVSVFGPVSGTTAPMLTSVSVPGLVTSAFNTHTFATPLAGAGSFLAGVWYFASDSVGLGSGTVNGQGHHGMVINDIVGTQFAPLTSLNALVGVTTGRLPVELQEFTIE
ncbi:MAG: hypothetical protein GY906_02075 [bacterium]|nr:hypothetical protein [bacterium]